MLLAQYAGEIMTATAVLAVQAAYGFAAPRLSGWSESRRVRRRVAQLCREIDGRVPGWSDRDLWAAPESAPRHLTGPARVRVALSAAPALSPGATGSPPLRIAGPPAAAVQPIQPASPPPGMVAAPGPACFERVPSVARVPLKPHLEMRPIDHVREFLSFVRDTQLGKHPKTGRWECRRDSDQWVAAYHAWAESRAIKVIPEWQLLGLLGQQAGVEKKRDRLKDAHGRVPKTDGGSPVRAYYYTITEVALETQAAAPRARRAA